jgi:glycosyltransferase involved in cell wall biosynthesis
MAKRKSRGHIESNLTLKIVCHLTTAHQSADVRIFERECKSLATQSNFKILLASHGEMPKCESILHIDLGSMPTRRLARFIKSQYVAARILCQYKVDIWHLHDPELLLFACFLIMMRKNLVWDSHEDYFLQFSNSSEYRTYLPKFFRKSVSRFMLVLLRFVDKNASLVISATKSINDKYVNEKKVIVGNEARLDNFVLCEPTFNSNKILFTGATDDSQCFREVVEALSSWDNLILMIAGKEPAKDEWNYAKKILGPQLLFLGWLDREELAKAMSASFAGLITYNDQETNSTNSPNKRFEFAAAGLPCIVTPTRSNINWAQESSGAIVASGFGPSDLQNAIAEMLSDEGVWRDKSNALRKWSHSFGDWAISEKLLFQAYEDLK